MAARLRAIGPAVRAVTVAAGDLTCPELTCPELTLPELPLPELTLSELTLPELVRAGRGRTEPEGGVVTAGAAGSVLGCGPGTGPAVVARSTKSESGSERRGELYELIPRS
jgi:hypothetical protein